MEELKQISIGGICLTIFILGFLWQGIVFERDGKNKGLRHWIPLGVSAFLILGAISYSILILIDPKIEFSLLKQLKLVGCTAAICIAFLLKNTFGPILISASLSWTIYFWFQHSELTLIPIFEYVIEWFLTWSPSWVKNLYIIGTLSYVIGSSLFGSFYDG